MLNTSLNYMNLEANVNKQILTSIDTYVYLPLSTDSLYCLTFRIAKKIKNTY